MRKRLPMIYGFVSGCGLGLCLLTQTSNAGIPKFISCWLGPLLEVVSRPFTTGERGPGGMLFAFLAIIFFWGSVGAGVGYTIARLATALRKRRKHESP